MKKGWERKRLGEIGKVSMCKRIFKGETTATGDIPFYKIGTFGKKPDAFIPSHIYSEYRAKHPFPKKGDVLISASGTIGRRVKYDGEPAYFQDSNIVWIDNDEKLVLNDYLYHFYEAHEWKSTKGATISRLYNDNLNQAAIAFPNSLPEQRRIAGILDEAFAGLATAQANAEKNLQNARALFESHLNDVFSKKGNGWVERRLEDIADSDCTLSYGIVQPGEDFDDGMPVVRPTDLTTKVIRLSGLKRINPTLAVGYKRTNLKGGELLLCVRGSTGVVSIAAPELVGANVTRGIVPIRFNPSLLLPEFGFYLISSWPVQSQIREKTYGAALMQINIRDLRVITLSYPALKEQKLIAAKLDCLHEETNRLADICERKLAALTALKKSVLHQAFDGEL